VVLNNLLRQTALRSSFNSIMLALVDGQPQVLPLRRCLELFVRHREEVIRRRSEYQLQRARDRDHIVQGLLLALDRIDEVIEIIRNSADVEESRNNLMQQLDLSEVQAQAILDMQLRRLAALERERLQNEHNELLQRIAELEALLGDADKIRAEIKRETRELRSTFNRNNPRRTTIETEEIGEETPESLIPQEDVIVTLSQRGYIKRVPPNTFRQQNRGGKGVRGMTTREGDAILDLLVVDTHSTLFFFTNRGRVYPLRAYQIPGDASRTSRGVLLSNLLPLQRNEQVQTMLLIDNPKDDYPLLLATRTGQVKSLKTGELTNIRPSGLIVMNLAQDDELVSVAQVGDAKDAMMVTERGQAIRFAIDDLTPRSRTAGGVRGIRLIGDDKVVAMGVVNPNSHLLVVSQGGYGKMTSTSSYTRKGRGGQGVRTFQVTEKAGLLAAAKIVTDPEQQEMLIISSKAQVVRISMDDVRETGRVAQGVILWKEREADDYVASIAAFQETDRNGEPISGTNGYRRANGRNQADDSSNGHVPEVHSSGDGKDSC
jgi:DNA gyrase subunit A